MTNENSNGYKLFYFDIIGRGDFIRLIFNYKHVPFEDVRIPIQDWFQQKPTSMMGQIPILELPGNQKMCQSYAIARYLAREFDLLGTDNFDNAEIDAMVDGLEEVLVAGANIIFSKFRTQMTEEERTTEWKRLQAELYPQRMKIVNDFLSKKSSGFFSEKGVTWADFLLFSWQPTFLEFAKLSEKDFPALEKYRKKMLEIPEVAKFCEKNKNIPFTFFEYNENGVPTVNIKR